MLFHALPQYIMKYTNELIRVEKNNEAISIIFPKIEYNLALEKAAINTLNIYVINI